jgi:hypothetical protein
MVIKLQPDEDANLDVPAIVKFFGGRQALVNDLQAYKIIKLGVAAIDKWQLRKDIPHARRADLQTLARKKRMRFSLANYSTNKTKKKAA